MPCSFCDSPAWVARNPPLNSEFSQCFIPPPAKESKTNFILIRLPAPSSMFQSTYKITQGPRNNYLNSPLETNIAIIPCAVAFPEEYFQRKLAHYGVYCICVFEFWRTSAFKTTVQLFFLGGFFWPDWLFLCTFSFF